MDLESRKLEPIAYLTELTGIMAKDPNYVETGFDERSLTAWGTFADGRVHMVSHNFKPTGTSTPTATIADTGQAQKAAGLAAAKPPELPGERKARLMHSFFTPFDGQAAIAEMSGWLSTHDYALQPGVEGDAHITTLRQIKGDGFFYINTHGGVKHTRHQDTGSPQMSHATTSRSLGSSTPNVSSGVTWSLIRPHPIKAGRSCPDLQVLAVNRLARTATTGAAWLPAAPGGADPRCRSS
ncbi:hypothetical protein [Variovorax boronicumulans]|uniref:hypothetical protein n=1 Tax=Variovorax boronicumulans TaxID=436515 RepID=UPI0012FDBAB5|nr:hypothetical protein [Variovorax boronicumulans]